jgi:hypothetical protein
MVYIIGLMILGFNLQHWHLIITGIVICSIGEFMVAPGYMAFVSKLAPKENVSAYIGCNFISYMIGLLGGTFVFGYIVAYVAVDIETPYLFYGILISFALVLFFAFIIYYKTWGQDVIERAKKIRALEEGEDKELGIPSDYKEPIMFRIFENRLTAVLPLLLVPIVLFGSYSFGTFHYIGPEEEVTPPFTPDDYTIIDGSSFEFDGTLQEGNTASETIDIRIGEGEYLEEGELLKSITFDLTWEDEPDQDFGPFGLISLENQPDEFSLTVTEDDNYTETESDTNSQGSEGRITITFDFEHNTIESINGTGEWVVVVTLDYCGDFEDPTSFITDIDNSNNYELVVTTEIYTPK